MLSLALELEVALSNLEKGSFRGVAQGFNLQHVHTLQACGMSAYSVGTSVLSNAFTRQFVHQLCPHNESKCTRMCFCRAKLVQHPQQEKSKQHKFNVTPLQPCASTKSTESTPWYITHQLRGMLPLTIPNKRSKIRLPSSRMPECMYSFVTHCLMP